MQFSDDDCASSGAASDAVRVVLHSVPRRQHHSSKPQNASRRHTHIHSTLRETADSFRGRRGTLQKQCRHITSKVWLSRQSRHRRSSTRRHNYRHRSLKNKKKYKNATIKHAKEALYRAGMSDYSGAITVRASGL